MPSFESSRIGRNEWRWVGACTALLGALVAVPYALALLRPPDGYLLARTLYYGNDLSQYMAAMGDAAASSSWVIQDHLTAEPHNPAFMYSFYVFLGKMASLFGLPHLLVFALACALSVPALIFAAYYFASAFTLSLRDRRTALLFLLLASGLGIWVKAVLTAAPAASGGPAFSYDRAEVSTYLLPFGPPHLTLALASLLIWGRSLMAWTSDGKRRSLVVLTSSVLAVGVLNPFTLATMVALSSGYALVRWASGGTLPVREAAAAAVVAVVAAPFLATNLVTFAQDPFWSVTYGRQNTTGSPPPWMLAVDFGLLLPLSMVGVFYRKILPERRTFIIFWSLALLVLMYVPVPFQRRFGFGLQPALAVLAALGMGYLSEYLRSHRLFLLGLGARVVVAVGLFAGTLLGYVLLIMAASGVGPLGETVYEPRGNVVAADWLASHSSEKDVVLASVETSNYLAGRIRGRVAVGHGAGTLDFDTKNELMRRFFDPATGPADRLEIARAERATMVFLGKRERALGGTSLKSEDGFIPIYDGEGIQVYRVR